MDRNLTNREPAPFVAEAKRPYFVGVWLSQQEMTALVSLAHVSQRNKSDVMRQLIEDAYGQAQNVPEPVGVVSALEGSALEGSAAEEE